MKIAFIAHDVNYQAGPAKVTAALIERLCEDHQVSVFSSSINGIDLSKIRHHKVPAVAHPTSLKYITFLLSSTIILACLSLLKKREFDIIHGSGYYCPFCTNVIISHFCERECLYLERANIIEIPHKNASQKLKAIDHRIYRRLSALLERLQLFRIKPKAFIVVSQHDKDLFVLHYGAVMENITVIPNGVDLAIFNSTNKLLYRDPLRQKHGISRNDLVLMFTGSDWERKGLRYVIEALSLLHRSDVRLLVAGSGDEKSYSYFAELKHVREYIIFVSHISNPWEYYASCDVFVLPTIYEAFGLTIIEAMASGLPIITSRSAGAADFITDGIDGLLLNDPTDINDLAAKIESLLSNAKLRRAMGQCARRTAEKLSWDRVAQKTLEVYNSVLEREKRSTCLETYL